LAIVIAQRERIEERANEPAQGALHDGDENIGEDVMETGPSADHESDVARIKTATADYSASALFLSPKERPQFQGRCGGYIELFIYLPFSARSDSIHDRRTGRRGDEKPAAEIDVSASTLPPSAR
jgi:hypothetical protein